MKMTAEILSGQGGVTLEAACPLVRHRFQHREAAPGCLARGRGNADFGRFIEIRIYRRGARLESRLGAQYPRPLPRELCVKCS